MRIKKIVGFENYTVDTNGNIYNIKKNKYLKQSLTKDGYLVVGLHKNGKSKTMNVHRIVAETFILNPENKRTVNHKDENKQNNCVDNLEWATNYENTNYGTRNKRSSKILHDLADGTHVLCIESNKTYKTISEASRETGCDRRNIKRCCDKTQKTSLGLHWQYV